MRAAHMQIKSPFHIKPNQKFKWAFYLAEQALGLKTLDHYYQKRQDNLGALDFLRYSLHTLNIETVIASGNLGTVPQQGPVIIVANHPFGAIEGIVLAELLLQRRSDVKILANQFLHRVPELADLFIGVDVFAGSNSSPSNTQGIKQAVRHLNNQGLLLIFPAGEVSAWHLHHKQVTDKTWHRIIGMMVRKTGAASLPVYIEGHNSALFHTAGLLHPRLRTLLLARELLNKRNKTIKLHIGDLIGSHEVMKPLLTIFDSTHICLHVVPTRTKNHTIFCPRNLIL
jgi:putative hemolysin